MSLEHVPTDYTRGEVSALVSFGNTQEEIARHLGISENTLAKHYRDELDNAVLRANAKVANSLFRKATEGDDVTAQKFWLKTRGRWRETDAVDKTSAESLLERVIDRLV